MSCQDSELSREEIKKKVGGRFRTVKRNGCQEQEMSSGSGDRRRCQDKEMSIRKRRSVKEVGARKGCNMLQRERDVERKKFPRGRDVNGQKTSTKLKQTTALGTRWSCCPPLGSPFSLRNFRRPACPRSTSILFTAYLCFYQCLTSG